jgi:hypothetical protein
MDHIMSFSVHPFSVSAGRLGLALLLASSCLVAQSSVHRAKADRSPLANGTAPVPTQAKVAEWARILNYMSLVQVPDGQGGVVTTLRITGINVQVVNGEGTTNTTNGLGNLIVGYNELGNPNGDERTGSHNLVTGQANSFSSYGGLVAGQSNTVSGPWSSVSGGWKNTASGYSSTVSGGLFNTASGNRSSVSGGFDNTASGQYSSVSGGSSRSAHGGFNWAAGSLSESY